MSVKVRVPGPLESLVGGQRVLQANGNSIRAVLDGLSAEYPGLRDRIFNEHGEIHRFVNVYLNDEDIRFIGGLDAAVRSGDTVAILPALAGGAPYAIR